MKRIHKLILRAFVGPFFASFSVILFVLVLQFLAKYIEDIFGKGFEALVLGKVFLYACMTLVPLALPLGVLLASLLTMGNLGERYELAAMKSSGIGLFRVMAPLTQIVVGITMFSLFFSFYIMPSSNLKLYTLLFDLSNVKPTFAIKSDHFYNGVDGLVIHVDDIDREADMLYNIKIYDHMDQVGNNRITLADRGKMVPSEQAGYLQMTLWDGVIHEKVVDDPQDKKNNQYQRFYFDTLRYKVVLSGFEIDPTEENTFSNHHYMLNIFELYAGRDSMKIKTGGYYVDLSDYNRKYIHVDTTMNSTMAISAAADTTDYGPDGKIESANDTEVVSWFPGLDPAELINKAVHQARAVKNYTNIIKDRIDRENLKIRKFRIEINNRWMLPISCLVFLFLGAPIGAIIRKGGIGLPVIFSIIFFILFYILMIQGKKFARDEIMSVWAGVWLPILIMGPMSFVFTYQSATDSQILYMQGWYRLWRLLTGWIPFLNNKKAGVQDRSTMTIEQLIELRQRYKDLAREAIEEAESKKKK